MNSIPATPGVANVREVTLVDADGSAVTNTEGATATYYLKALTGTNAGKWWKASDSTWSATEIGGGSMTHTERGIWSVSVAAGAWVDGVVYREYAVDSGGLAIVVAQHCYGAIAVSSAVAGALSSWVPFPS